jgi:ribosomal protein RSM22 (predicted rRNA methylase)
MDEPLDSLANLIYEYLYGEVLSDASFQNSPSSRLAEIAQGVAELSNLYTRQRRWLSPELLTNSSLRNAYLAYFLPCNLVKVRRIFQEILAHPKGALHFMGHRRLLDIGCGPGTNLLAFLSLLVEGTVFTDSLECVALDSVRANLQDAQYLFSRYTTRLKQSKSIASLGTYQAELMHPRSLSLDGSFDFVVFGNVLNELFMGRKDRIEKRCELVAAFAQKWLATDGFLILLEPALKETSRELLLLRDCLLDHTDLRVYAPCVHNLHCPAVAPENVSDWCHEDRSWIPPRLIQAIDALVGNRKDSLKYSYAVFNRLGLSVAEAAHWQASNRGNSSAAGLEIDSPFSSQVWRVVSERLDEKGKSSAYFCGPEGRTRVTRLRKHGSKNNQDFDELARGQVVLTNGLRMKSISDWRVEAKTVVKDLM